MTTYDNAERSRLASDRPTDYPDTETVHPAIRGLNMGGWFHSHSGWYFRRNDASGAVQVLHRPEPDGAVAGSVILSADTWESIVAFVGAR